MTPSSFNGTCLALIAGILLSCGCTETLTVKLENPLNTDRTDEIIEIPADVLEANGFENPVVTDSGSNEVASQITYEGALIFAADVPAGGSAEYMIKEGAPSEYKVRAYGRFVPERKDDICWENDRIAFRAYGPALEAGGELSSGYDVWVKSTDEMVIDHRYSLEFTPDKMEIKAKLKAAGDKKGYQEFKAKYSIHIDHGNGMDYYAVGRTLGAGAMTPYTEGKLWLANNFSAYEVLDNGPLRFTCRLDYAPFEVDGRMVREQRLISIDAGSQFNHAIVKYTEDGNSCTDLTVAAGIVLHGTEDYVMAPEKGYAYYADPASPTDGQTYLAVIFDESGWSTKVDCNHLLAITDYTSAEGVSYHFGAGWSKYGFETPEDWGRHVEQEALELHNPIIVSIY